MKKQLTAREKLENKISKLVEKIANDNKLFNEERERMFHSHGNEQCRILDGMKNIERRLDYANYRLYNLRVELRQMAD